MSFRYYVYRTLEPLINRNIVKRHKALNYIRSCVGYIFIPRICSVQGSNMYLHKSGHSFEMAFLGVYEKLESEYLKTLDLSGKVAIDVGACIGYYSLMLSKKVGNNGKVYAFEPEKENYALLNKNIALNHLESICFAYNVGVGDYDGNTSLRVHKSPGQHSIDIKTQERGNLKMVFLDYILTKDEYSNVGFIKIDVEGYEHKVLKGMSAIVKNSPNIVIQLEYAPQHLADYNFVFEEFADLIKRMNLKVEYWDLKDSLKKHIHDIFWLNDPTVVNDFKEGIKYSRNLILTRQDG